MPKKVFISYRRDDSKWPTDRLFQALMRELPSGFVFMDTDVIPFGVDFVEYFDFWIRQCKVFLAIIGPDWLDAVDPKTGRRRLDNPDDFVRVEIRQALLRNIEVVPVLLDETPMPDKSQLPPDIRQLVFRNSASIEHRTADADTARLIRRLGLWEEDEEGPRTDENAPPRVEQRPNWLKDERTDDYGPWQQVDIAGQLTLFRWIPPGTFQMGSPGDDREAFDDEIAHEVTLTEGFWMADTPSTQALWEAITGQKPSEFDGPNRPVENVSWEEVQSAIHELNERMPGLDARLPTEAQWEYACRAGSKSQRYDTINEVAWYEGNSNNETHPVAEKAKNAWGLYDMLGNVYEWCVDCTRPYSEEPITDPKGRMAGSHPCVRGGSWSSPGAQVRAAERSLANRAARESRQGFRLSRGTAIASSARLQPQDQLERKQSAQHTQVGEAVARARAQEGQSQQMLPVTTPVALEVAANLIPLMEDKQGGGRFLNELVPMMRDGLFYELGVKFPGVRVRGNETDLPEGTYIIMINEVPRVKGNVSLDRILVNDTVDRLKLLNIEGTPAINPANGAQCAWIDAQYADSAEEAGLTTWDAAGYMILHLSSVLRENAATFVGIQETANMLEQLEQAFPALVQEATQRISLGQLTEILSQLVAEEISIRDLRQVLQSIVDAKNLSPDPITLTELIRANLKQYITHKYTRGQTTLHCYIFAPEIEETIGRHIQGTDTDLRATLPPDFVRSVSSAIRAEVGTGKSVEKSPVLLTKPELRPYIRDLLSEEFPYLAVISHAEISADVDVQPISRLSLPSVSSENESPDSDERTPA